MGWMMLTMREWLEHLDLTDRVGSIESTCAELPVLVVERFRSTWDSNEGYKKRAANRREAFRDDGKPSLPLPAHLGWEHELFEFVFQETLHEIEARALDMGKSHTAISDCLVSNAVASVRLDVGLELSLGPRPEVPLPSEVSDAISEAAPIEELNGRFDQWTRIGFYESELTNTSFEQGSRIQPVENYSSLVSLDDEREVANVRIPLTRVDAENAWTGSSERSVVRIAQLRGALTAGFTHKGSLSRAFVLAPNPILVSALHLRSGYWPGPLCLLDKYDQPAIALRVWKSRPVQSSSVGTTFRLIGCELLMRSDLLTDFEDWNDGRIKYVQRRLDL